MLINMQSTSYTINNESLRPIHPNRRISHTQQIWGAALWLAVSVTVLQICKHVTMQF